MSEFDQNCISPGTEFMIKLDHALNDFVKNKVKFDRSWQNGDILISGPNVSFFLFFFHSSKLDFVSEFLFKGKFSTP